MYQAFFKFVFDFLVSLIGLALGSPIFFMVGLILSFANRSNPFFLQPRPGKGGKMFIVIKFKTMNDKKDAEGNLLPDAERLTHVGKFVRKISLDEIPQLLNVIIGDMSLVGPRPLLPEYLPLYSKDQARRHEVKPGITGWAQINGRNAISWDEKFKLDIWYVDNLSIFLDIKILILTILKIIKSEGINSSTSETMPKFSGE